MTYCWSHRIILGFAISVAHAVCFGYGQDTLPGAPSTQAPINEKGLMLAIVKDQIPIWTGPVRVRTHDLVWLLPLGAATAVTLATDTRTMRELTHDRTLNKDSVNASNALLGGNLAVPAILYGVGYLKQDAHARQTGILSGEALVDSVIVQEVAKIIFRRERPLTNRAAGDFFSAGVGTGSSFPSSHSILAWSSAAVVAGQYPSKWVGAGVYTVATAVSLSRVVGQEHFPTDVLVGGTIGWLIGRFVVNQHRYRLPR